MSFETRGKFYNRDLGGEGTGGGSRIKTGPSYDSQKQLSNYFLKAFKIPITLIFFSLNLHNNPTIEIELQKKKNNLTHK